MGNPKLGGVSASWDSNEVMLFCDLCIKEIQLGNRPTTHFSKDGWKNLITGFKERTGKAYDRTQMKNKWDHLKKDWKLWQELKHGETGLGWDPEKKTIAASEVWWEEKIKVVPAARKFKHAGIAPDLEEKLNIMFSQVVATGEDSWAPSIGSLPPDMRPDEVEDTEEGDVRTQGRTSTNIPSTSSGKRRKTLNKGMTATLMTELRNAALSVQPSPYISLADAVEQMCKIPEIRADRSLYYFALEHMKEKNNREIFVTIPEEDRLWWIMSAYEKNDI